MHPELGPVLVVGADSYCSRLRDSAALEIWVLDLDTEHNRFPHVSYCDVDITSHSNVQAVLEKIIPRTIIHTASPNVLTEHPNFATRKDLIREGQYLGSAEFD